MLMSAFDFIEECYKTDQMRCRKKRCGFLWLRSEVVLERKVIFDHWIILPFVGKVYLDQVIKWMEDE